MHHPGGARVGIATSTSATPTTTEAWVDRLETSQNVGHNSIGGASSVLEDSCLGGVLRFLGILSNVSSGGVTISMGQKPNKTSNKHAVDYSSKTKYKNSETQHQISGTEPQNSEAQHQSLANGFETEQQNHQQSLSKPVFIPPFPFPTKQNPTYTMI